ncbi:MAG: RHS repeat-associated core domain-containing protein, partial [Anaerolineae bacterium]
MIYTSSGESYLHLPGVIMTEKAGLRRYLLPDGLGSIRQAIDASSVIMGYNEFDPYGNPIVNRQSEIVNPYGFTGEWWQSEVGLLHLRARWYNASDGIFLSRDMWEGDELRPLSMNGWNYVEGNPVNYVDPSGRCRGLTGKAFDLCVRAVTTAAKSWWWYDSNVNQGMYNYTRSGILTGFEGVMWWDRNVNQGMYNYTRSGILGGLEGVMWWEQNVNRPMIYGTREALCEFLNPCREKLIPVLPNGTFSIGPGVLAGAIFAGR